MAEIPDPTRANPGPSDPTTPGPAATSPDPVAAATPVRAGAPLAAVQPAAAEAAAVAARQLAAGEVLARDVALRGRTWWSRLDATTKRPTLIVAGALLALVLGTQILNAVIPGPAAGGNGSNGGTTNGATALDLGLGLSVTPPSGWVVVGPANVLQGIRLQRGSVIVDLLVAPYDGSATELLTTYVNQVLVGESNSMTLHDVVVLAPGNGRPAARATYDGIFKGAGRLDGEISTQVFGSTGVVVDAAGREGTLPRALADVHQMLGTMEVRQ